MEVNCEFNSFTELSAKIKEYESTNFIQLYKRSSRTVEKAGIRASKRKFNSEIKFAELDLHCVHGGKKFKSISRGKRPNQTTYQMDCPCFIKIRSTTDGQRLYVKEANHSHNHAVSKEQFDVYPKQRKITDPEVLKVASSILSLSGDRRLLQNHLKSLTGKNVLLKDVHNLVANRITSLKDDNMEILINEMRNIYNATVEVVADQQNTINGIFFQDPRMKYVYDSYPELLLIDATYKLNDLRIPLYILACVDGLGDTEVAGLWVLLIENEDCVRHMTQLFKIHNPKSDLLEVILVDQDMEGREILIEVFPDAHLQISYYHTMRMFKRDITASKMAITEHDRLETMKIITTMVNSVNENQYQQEYEKLMNLKLKSVIMYFDKTWHDVRNQWVECFKSEKRNYLKRTNHRIETLNQKLKFIISKFSGIAAFFKELITCVHSKDIENNQRTFDLITKRRVNAFHNEPEQYYDALLTHYAMGFVSKQFQLSTLSTPTSIISNESAMYATCEGIIVTELNNCKCAFFQGMKLPCSHILNLRRKLSVDEFDRTLCSVRWTQEYFRRHYRLILSANAEAPINSIIEVPQPPSGLYSLSAKQMYRNMSEQTQKIANLSSHMTQADFQKAYENVSSLCDILSRQKYAIVQEVNDEEEITFTTEQIIDIKDIKVICTS